MKEEKLQPGSIVGVTIAAIFIMLLVLAAYLFITIRIKQQAILQAQKSAELTAKDIKNTVEIYFRDALILNHALANNFLQYKKNQVPRLTAYYILKQTLIDNNRYLAFWTMWEQNAYDNKDRLFAKDSLHDVRGTFAVAYYFDNGIVKFEKNDTADFYEDFYVIPFKTKKPLILDPFHYQYHGNSKSFFETSMVTPIIENDRTLGVFGIDLGLEQLQNELKGIKVFTTGYVSIISNSGLVVTHPKEYYIDKNIGGLFSRENIWILNEFKQGKFFTSRSKSEFTGKAVTRFFYPINTQYMVAPWYIMIEVPDDEIYAGTQLLKIISVFVLITLLLLVFYMLYILVDKRKLMIKIYQNQLFSKNITEQVPDIIYIVDLKLEDFIYSNKSIRSYLGYNELSKKIKTEEFLYKIVHPNCIHVLNQYKKLKESNSQVNYFHEFEISMLDAHGEWRHFRGKEKEFTVVDNKIESIIGVLNDISDLKKAELLLRENEKKYRSIIENANDAILILNQNEIVECNYKSEELFGLTKEEILTKMPYNLSPMYQPDGIESEVKSRIFRNKAWEGESQFFEWKHIKNNGEEFDAEVSLNQIDLEDRKFLLAIIRDISSRKQIEQELRKHRDHLEFLVNERTNEINSLNEELRQSNEVLYNAVEELNAQKEELTRTLNRLKETQDQLVQSEKMAALGVLAAGIAHEINNPLNFISTSVQILNGTYAEIQEYLMDIQCLKKEMNEQQNSALSLLDEKWHVKINSENIPKIQKNLQVGVDRVAEIVKGLRLYSRLDNSEKVLSNIHEIIDTATLLLHNKIKHTAKLEKCYGNIPLIPCYYGKVSQVLVNILSNAIDAIEHSGKNADDALIQITTRTNDKFVEISITDNGTGIKEEIINKIFDPFYTTKETGKGIGLGLSISMGIVKDHKGTIVVKNRNEGGCIFTIFLPIKND